MNWGDKGGCTLTFIPAGLGMVWSTGHAMRHVHRTTSLTTRLSSPLESLLEHQIASASAGSSRPLSMAVRPTRGRQSPLDQGRTVSMIFFAPELHIPVINALFSRGGWPSACGS